jgi:hypothetical protein
MLPTKRIRLTDLLDHIQNKPIAAQYFMSTGKRVNLLIV